MTEIYERVELARFLEEDADRIKAYLGENMKLLKALVSRCDVTSTPGVTRTRDILLRRQMLYPAELRGPGT